MRKFVLVAALLFGAAGCTTVDAGHVGVPTYFGAVGDEALGEGLHGINPFTTTVYHVDVRIQKLTVNASATSSDLQTVTSVVALNYRVNKDEALDLYQNIGVSYQDTVVTPYLQEAIKTVTAQYTAEQLISQRPKVKAEILELIRSGLEKSHIVVTDLSVEDFQFDDEYQEAITKKQVAEQSAKQAENDLQRIEVEARQVAAAAEGEAAATLARERASAEALLIRAEAEAEALKIQGRHLTPELIQLRAVEKWDGNLPQYQGADESFINIK